MPDKCWSGCSPEAHSAAQDSLASPDAQPAPALEPSSAGSAAAAPTGQPQAGVGRVQEAAGASGSAGAGGGGRAHGQETEVETQAAATRAAHSALVRTWPATMDRIEPMHGALVAMADRAEAAVTSATTRATAAKGWESLVLYIRQEKLLLACARCVHGSQRHMYQKLHLVHFADPQVIRLSLGGALSIQLWSGVYGCGPGTALHICVSHASMLW